MPLGRPPSSNRLNHDERSQSANHEGRVCPPGFGSVDRFVHGNAERERQLPDGGRTQHQGRHLVERQPTAEDQRGGA